MQLSTCTLRGKESTKNREKSSTELLAMLQLIQPATQLIFSAARAHCPLMSNFLPRCSPGPSVHRCFPAGLPGHDYTARQWKCLAFKLHLLNPATPSSLPNGTLTSQIYWKGSKEKCHFCVFFQNRLTTVFRTGKMGMIQQSLTLFSTSFCDTNNNNPE